MAFQRLFQHPGAVGRVQENQVEFLPAAGEKRQVVPLHHPAPAPLAWCRLQIRPDERGGLLPRVHKGAGRRTPGQSLDAHLARTAEEVQHSPSLYVKLDDIEGRSFTLSVVGRVSSRAAL